MLAGLTAAANKINAAKIDVLLRVSGCSSQQNGTWYRARFGLAKHLLAEDCPKDCKKQHEALKQHLVELDKELEEESRRHSKEKLQMQAKIDELQGRLQLCGENEAADVYALERELESAKSDLDKSRGLMLNLHTSLELIESRFEEEVRERTAKLQLKLAKLQQSFDEMKEELLEKEERLQGASASLMIEQKLTRDLEASSRLIDQLNAEINQLQRHATGNPDGMIEKGLISNLLVSLLSCPMGDRVRRIEMLTVIAQVLGLSPTQRQDIGLEQQDMLAEYTNPRLGELWTSFLLGQT